MVSQASDKWQQECEVALQKLVEHIDASDWGHRCIGIQPNGGVNEWFVSHGHEWPDYGLLSCSGLPGLAHSVALPMPKPPNHRDLKIEAGQLGRWFDPAQGERRQNWWRFYHELNATRLVETCSALKKASNDRLIVGAFYGYIGDSYTNGEPAGWLYGHHHELAAVTEHPGG